MYKKVSPPLFFSSFAEVIQNWSYPPFLNEEFSTLVKIAERDVSNVFPRTTSPSAPPTSIPKTGEVFCTVDRAGKAVGGAIGLIIFTFFGKI